MAVIALMMTISASAQFYIYCSDGNVIKVDSISMIAPADEPDTPVEPEEPDTPTEPEEPTNPSAGIGVFSVSADKQVTFSRGNLQYTRSTDTWSFASAQWEMLGTDNVTGGSVSSDQDYGDSKYGDALADKIDLFGWSTSTTNFGVSTSTDNANYSGSFVDWGTNKIGNDAPNTWRTLSYDEWEYLLNTRPNASFLKGVAQVNDVNGLILLPDSWTCPSGVTFKSGFHSNNGVDYYAAYQTFTAAEWSKLESAGAVFLPAAGIRGGTDVYIVQSHGYYWSATEYFSTAICLAFRSDEAHMDNSDSVDGLSVRLVKDIEGGGATPDTPNTPDTPTEPEEPENTENGHEYVDLGLSVKWATCNVGATKPEEYGDYFAWGEVEPKEVYDWSTYKYCNGPSTTLTKYNYSSSYGTVDNKTQLELSDDAASANWGGSWRMPSKVEQDELREQCTWTWTSQNGINGCKVTSKKNGKSIFLPAAGYRDGSLLVSVGSYGDYWSSSLYMWNPELVNHLNFGNSGYVSWGNNYRCYGQSVRPVCQ